ncbi:MAG: Gfo/Idh/MocA family oxidoreductase [Candidatus Latescibacteria bacterium]|jgi:predicted dehydrogenase|nr:Gfo/Idh/MocA family oxidoreductase [Candidatus Latescibacterota bacterium]HJP32771.1 Gfo/Idh/MocA family oxidoreductase [Candidatus Latescibacterota bacterium]
MTSPSYGVVLLSFSRHSHQRNFVPGFAAHPCTHIVAVADDDDAIDDELRRVNRQRADELEVPYLPTVAAALDRSDVDIVSIAHDIERRAELSIQAATAGKHLWIDKFLGATLEECDEVVTAVSRAGVRAIVPSYHYGSLVQQSLALLDSGRLGDLLGVHADILFSKGWPEDPDGVERRQPTGPAGRWKYAEVKRELLTVGAYGVGLLQACLEPPRAVIAHGGARFFAEHERTNTEDFATLTMTDARGRIGSLCAGRIGVATHPSGGPALARLVGTRATVTIDAKRPGIRTFLRDEITGADLRPPPDDPMQWASGPPALRPPVSADPAGLLAALDDFVSALDEERPPAYSVTHARDNMEILLAGYRSMVTGGEVVHLG